MPRDDLPALTFDDPDHFARWLADNHASSPGLWLMIPKKGGDGTGPTYLEALAEALRYGWIDSQKAKHDDHYFLQRFTPRRARSKWSKVNVDKATALIEAGRMEPAGQAEVDAAKSDGRWDAAYDPPSTATLSDDFRAALEARPGALEFFESLTSSQRFSFLYRVQEAKRPETRARRIQKFADMCQRGEKP